MRVTVRPVQHLAGRFDQVQKRLRNVALGHSRVTRPTQLWVTSGLARVTNVTRLLQYAPGAPGHRCRTAGAGEHEKP